MTAVVLQFPKAVKKPTLNTNAPQWWHTLAVWCLDSSRASTLTERQRAFLKQVASQHKQPSPRQLDWLDALANKLGLVSYYAPPTA